MSKRLASEVMLLTHLVDMLALPAYVTDRLNRVRAVNHAFATTIGDPLSEGLRGDDLFVHSLILGPYRERFPRRYAEIGGCLPALVGEIESGALKSGVRRLLQRALQQDKVAARFAQDALERQGRPEWDGTVRFLTRDGLKVEFSETVVPLGSAESGETKLFLNLWTKPERRSVPEPAQTLLSLSPREREVATLYSAGYSTGEVAETLGISVHTAGDHRDSIYSKLGIHSRAELARLFTF